MKLEPGKFCPLIQADCKGLECSWFTQVRGHNPNTGQEVDEWGCAITWLPVMLVENSQQQRQTGAAVESFRNEATRYARNVAAILSGNQGGTPHLTLEAVQHEGDSNPL